MPPSFIESVARRPTGLQENQRPLTGKPRTSPTAIRTMDSSANSPLESPGNLRVPGTSWLVRCNHVTENLPF